MAACIVQEIEAADLTQSAAAALLGVDQPKVSRIIHGQLAGFSTPRLLRFLVRLGRDVDIVVHHRRRAGPGRAGHLRVVTDRRRA